MVRADSPPPQDPDADSNAGSIDTANCVISCPAGAEVNGDAGPGWHGPTRRDDVQRRALAGDIPAASGPRLRNEVSEPRRLRRGAAALPEVRTGSGRNPLMARLYVVLPRVWPATAQQQEHAGRCPGACARASLTATPNKEGAGISPPLGYCLFPTASQRPASAAGFRWWSRADRSTRRSQRVCRWRRCRPTWPSTDLRPCSGSRGRGRLCPLRHTP